MKIALITIGKTKELYLIDAINDYIKRLSHYTRLEIHELSSVKNTKNLSINELINKESQLIIKEINKSDYVILLDERGVCYTSIQLANKLQKWVFMSKKRIVFIIGGAYGFSKHLHEIADMKLSLSNMTFSHQIVRLIFLEQIYRAYTILNNEPYHNE
tara:strand:+ start:131 stop:604 length:474 start_codon:yes stop_codon:yes gene_type:complete